MRRFLWVVNSDLSTYSKGALLAERFQVWAPHLLLDTRPNRELPTQADVPEAVVPYLRLSALPLQVPRPFTVLSLPNQSPLLLLEDAPLATSPADNGEVTVELLPTLASQWAGASPLRQLNWLRQLCQLWPFLAEEGVEASLLVPDFLRVDGSLLRLLALHASGKNSPTLADVGRQWQALATTAHPAIRDFLQELVRPLGSGSGEPSGHAILDAIAQTERQLEQGLAALFRHQSVRLETVTLTDQGPSRTRNEDACYPPSGTVTQGTIHPDRPGAEAAIPATLSPLVIVCDGIGGHESGNVASQLAITTLQQQLATLQQRPNLAPAAVADHIRQAVLAANDAIAQRNDQERRQERERMGTTLVAALVYPPYLFIAHLGDSRAYRVGLQSCCQVTLDDDVAARESRLGYAFYRDALQYPNAGALVQALGIGESGYLHPTVQHFLLDDDSLFLICSDGLSDFDRIDSFWLQTIRPALLGQMPLAQVGQQLVNLANGYNGHDNVTVGLVTLTPQPGQSFSPLPARLAAQPADPTRRPVAAAAAPTRLVEPTTVLQAPSRKRQPGRSRWPWLGLAAAIAALLGGGLWWAKYAGDTAQPLASLRLSRFTVMPRLTPNAPLSVATSVGSFWQVRATPISGGNTGPGLLSLNNGADPNVPPTATGQNAPLIPAGSILKVVSRLATPDNVQWVRLQVCSIPSGLSLAEPPQETDSGAPAGAASGPSQVLADRLSQPGEVGWLLEPQLTTAATALAGLTPTQKGVCP